MRLAPVCWFSILFLSPYSLPSLAKVIALAARDGLGNSAKVFDNKGGKSRFAIVTKVDTGDACAAALRSVNGMFKSGSSS
jgi:hypothetical protein